MKMQCYIIFWSRNRCQTGVQEVQPALIGRGLITRPRLRQHPPRPPSLPRVRHRALSCCVTAVRTASASKIKPKSTSRARISAQIHPKGIKKSQKGRSPRDTKWSELFRSSVRGRSNKYTLTKPLPFISTSPRQRTCTLPQLQMEMFIGKHNEKQIKTA